nr:hypothetical protein [Tanacetum cinerariifolium]
TIMRAVIFARLYFFIVACSPISVPGDFVVNFPWLEGEVPPLELSRGRVIPLAGVNDQGDDVVQGVGNDNVNEGRGGAAIADQTKESDPIFQIRGIDIELDVEAQALVADKPTKFRKKKTVDGVGGSGHPLKRLREDHDTSGDASASIDGKSLAALQDLFDKSTLAAEIGVTAAATVPFHLFYDEVSSVVSSTVSDPLVLTTAIATTVVAGTSVPQPMEVNEPAHASIFADSTSASNVGSDVAGPSQPAGNDISSESFYVSLNMDSKTLHQIYVLKWDVLNESVLDDSNACHSLVDQLAPPVFFSQLRAMKYDQLFTEFIVGAARQTCIGEGYENSWFEGLDILKEAEPAKEIHLRSRITDIEAADANKTDLSSLHLSCDDLSIKSSTLESEKDKLVDQNPPYKFKWTEKTVPVTEGSSETTTEGYMENYKNISQDIRDQLNAEAEAIQIILTGIVNDIYSTVDACPNACEISQQTTRNRGNAIVNSSAPIYDQEPTTVTKDDEMSKEKEIDKVMALISPSRTRYGNQRVVNVAGAWETVEQADWKDDTDDESDNQELEAHYMYIAQIQEVTPDIAGNSGPIFNVEPLQNVQNNNDNYNVFGDDQEYHEQPVSVNEPYPDMCYDREHDDHDDTDELA